MYSRREILLSMGGALASLAVDRSLCAEPEGRGPSDERRPQRTRLGICTDSYAIRRREDRNIREPSERFGEPFRFLSYCHDLGAGGIQLEIGKRDPEYASRLQRQAQDWDMFVEASIRLPQDQADAARFEADIVTAKNAGVTVVRVVMPSQGSGRRYEAYDSAEAFRQMQSHGRRMLELAESVAARHRTRLAVENHKDERIPERLETLKSLSSEYVGACVDTGNDLSFLEEPMAAVEAYAPWAFSVHLKDMAIQEYEEGFLLAEVPLGDGLLDLPNVVRTLRSHHPQVRFSLEMMTRDPLKVPCLTDRYWATMGDVPGQNLARTLRMVRLRGRKEPLPRISHLPLSEQIEIEDANVRRCLAYAAGLVAWPGEGKDREVRKEPYELA
jgi:3-oxoisoapionate decarboxylase